MFSNIEANVKYEKIDPTLDGKIDNSQKRLCELQEGYDLKNVKDSEEIKKLRENLLNNIDLHWD